MPRPTTKAINPRRIVKGTVIRLPGNGSDEVVRSVSIVLHLANGADIVYAEDTEAAILVDQPKILEDHEIAPQSVTD